jgi:hypothetical protein
MSTEYIIIFTNLLVFIVSPFLPNVFYDYFVETYVGATVLLLVLLYSITYGYLVAVSTFTGIASLYAESHVRKASKVKKTKVSTDTYEKQLAPAENLLPNEVHPEAHVPEEENVAFLPKEESDSNNFKALDSSINEKEALPTISLSKDATNVYEENNLSDKLE